MKNRSRKRIRASVREIQMIVIIFVLVSLVPLPAPASAATQSAQVLPAPDLTLTSTDIVCSPEIPVAGQPVNITAIIHNTGNAVANNVTVQFYVDSTPIPQRVLAEISQDSQKIAFINFIFISVASHNVTVEIDANNTVIEIDEANNRVIKYIPLPTPPPTPSSPPGGGGGGGIFPLIPTPEPHEPLIISNITLILGTSVTITWETNELSDSTVKYGVTSGQYTIEKSDPNFVLFHSIQLEGIQEYATYYFVVNSRDLNGNLAQSSEYIFVLTPPSNEEAVERSSPAFPSKEAAVEKKSSPFNWWTVLIAVIAAIIISAVIKWKK